MVPMATEAQPTGQPQESVVEFGVQQGEPRPGRPRWHTGGFLAGLAADRRTVPLSALLGAVAVFGSLVSEWQVTSVDLTAFGGVRTSDRPMTAGVADLGGWGGGYLAGLFVLSAAIVLVLFGPAPGRRYARLIGLSGGGVLLGTLVAMAQSLRHGSRALDLVYTLSLSPDQLRLTYGRGLWCAFAGVAAAMLALYLAGRHIPEPAEPVADRPAGDRPAPETESAAWSWRRPPSDRDDRERPAVEPFDLTVSPAPYTQLDEDHRDKPNKT